MKDLLVSPKVLLVENSNGYPVFPAYGFEKRGYQVIKALHGYEALPLAMRHSDLLAAFIVDSDLRFMGSGEIAKNLRKIRPEAQVVVLYPDRRWPFLPESLPWLPARRTAGMQERTRRMSAAA